MIDFLAMDFMDMGLIFPKTPNIRMIMLNQINKDIDICLYVVYFWEKWNLLLRTNLTKDVLHVGAIQFIMQI